MHTFDGSRESARLMALQLLKTYPQPVEHEGHRFKAKLFAEMDQAAPVDSIIASSSSGITPSVMQAQSVRAPGFSAATGAYISARFRPSCAPNTLRAKHSRC